MTANMEQTTLFVGTLRHDITEEEILGYFEVWKCGEVSVRLGQNRNRTPYQDAHAFVTFANYTTANHVRICMDGRQAPI